MDEVHMIEKSYILENYKSSVFKRKQLHLSSLPFVAKVWNEDDRQEVNLLVKTPSSAHYYTGALRRYNELQLIQWRKQQQFYLSVHEQKDDKRKTQENVSENPANLEQSLTTSMCASWLFEGNDNHVWFCPCNSYSDTGHKLIHYRTKK